MGIYLGSNALGGSSGTGTGGLLNMVTFKSSGTWDPTDPYGDSSDLALEENQLVHFLMVGGGRSGRRENTLTSAIGGEGGRLWIGTLRLADETNSVTITIGAGGTGSYGAGTATTAVQAGSDANKIDISTASSDSRSTPGGNRSGINHYTGDISVGTGGTMGYPPFSHGGGLSNNGYNGSRGANTGDGGNGYWWSSDGSGGAGGSGIVIISW